MKNNECTIYIITNRGSTQIYRKGVEGWKQTSSKGIVRSLSAEQLLSHILPILAGVSNAKIVVEWDKKKTKKVKISKRH